MAEKLVERHNQSEGVLRVLAVAVCVLLVKEENTRFGRLGVNVAEIDVLEPFKLSDIIIIGDVDTNWRS